MKKLLRSNPFRNLLPGLTLLALLLFAVSAHASTVTLAWDPNPAAEQVTGYSVYQDGVKVWSGPATTATVANVAPGPHSFTATAVNLWGESPQSLPATTPPGPSAPKGVAITVTVTVTTN